MPEETGLIDLGPLKMPLPEMVRKALGFLVVIGAVVWGGFWIWEKSHPGETLVSKEFIAQQQEMQRHFAEEPAAEETFLDMVQIRVYESDGCVSATRSGPGGILATRFMVDMGRVAPPPVDIGEEMAPMDISFAGPVPVAGCPPNTGRCYGPCRVGSPCNGSSARPHPGEFHSWYGEQRGDWVQVWRRWPDCCQHSQWYHPMSGYWDENINWSYCVH